ncbi:Putative ripening-related protein 2 [Linum perenne]
MKKNTSMIISTTSTLLLLLIFTLLSTTLTEAYHGQTGSCRPSGKLRGKKPPSHQCNKDNDSECCREGKLYTAYTCSPPVTRNHPTRALLTLNSFEKGKDGGGPSECDDKFHSDKELIVALSTGWFKKKKRCSKFIKIKWNGKTVRAKVVDECDSAKGCDKDHDFQPPCPNNVVDASKAVWKALGVPSKDWGSLKVTWSDA